MIDWDEYRAKYRNMSHQDQIEFYDKVWENYPIQKHFDSETCKRFLGGVLPGNVIEIGGWRGELADEMLREFPEIRSWTNYEICRGAVRNSVPTDDRFTACVPNEPVWKLMLDPFRILIASHVIEHMNVIELFQTIESIRPRAAFVASPLTNEGQNWRGYNGSHVLSIGWDDVISIFEYFGLRHVPHFDTDEVRCFIL